MPVQVWRLNKHWDVIVGTVHLSAHLFNIFHESRPTLLVLQSAMTKLLIAHNLQAGYNLVFEEQAESTANCSQVLKSGKLTNKYLKPCALFKTIQSHNGRFPNQGLINVSAFSP